MNKIKELLKKTTIYDLYIKLNERVNEAKYVKVKGGSSMGYSVSKMFYDISPKEYVYFHWGSIGRKDKHAFVFLKEQIDFYHNVNTRQAHDLLCDKYLSYLRFEDYYKRECHLESPALPRSIYNLKYDGGDFVCNGGGSMLIFNNL